MFNIFHRIALAISVLFGAHVTVTTPPLVATTTVAATTSMQVQVATSTIISSTTVHILNYKKESPRPEPILPITQENKPVTKTESPQNISQTAQVVSSVPTTIVSAPVESQVNVGGILSAYNNLIMRVTNSMGIISTQDNYSFYSILKDTLSKELSSINGKTVISSSEETKYKVLLAKHESDYNSKQEELGITGAQVTTRVQNDEVDINVAEMKKIKQQIADLNVKYAADLKNLYNDSRFTRDVADSQAIEIKRNIISTIWIYKLSTSKHHQNNIMTMFWIIFIIVFGIGGLIYDINHG